MAEINKIALPDGIVYDVEDATARGYINDSVTIDFADVATSGDYNDLINKPTIPAAQVQSDWNATSGMGVILNKPTTLAGYGITDAEIGTDGSITLGGVSVSIPIISTNVVSDKNDDTRASSPKSVYSEIHPATSSSQPAGGMLPNVLYKLGTLTGNVTISFAAASDANIENEYKFTFTAGSTAPTITWPASITMWAGNCVTDGSPEITGGNYYEVSVLDGVALIVEVAV